MAVKTSLKIKVLPSRGGCLVVCLSLVGCYDSELLPWPEVGRTSPPTDAHAPTPEDGGLPDAAVHLDGALLDGALLDGALLDGALLDGALLDGALLDGALLDGALLDGALLDGALLDATADTQADATPDAEEPLVACPAFAPGRALGNVGLPSVVEASGVAESWRTPGVLWMHNDSGDTARVFAVRTTGEALATFELDGARPVDWEDLAVGPGPDPRRSYVYAGDVGDNLLVRANIRLRRFPEPEIPVAVPPPTVRLVGVESFTLVYPDGPHNCETLLVDPRTADVFVVSKSNDGISPIYRAAAPLSADRDNPLERVGSLTFGPAPLQGNTLTTGGSFTRTGDAILIKTYGSAFLWRRGRQATVAQALATDACPVPLAAERQGEAIGFAVDGNGYYTVSEGAASPIHFYERR